MNKCWIALLLCAISCNSHIFAADAETIRSDNRQVAELLTQSYIFVGGGSGVLISPEGHILSNHHVTVGQWTWEVRLADGRSFEADIISTDPVGDISLLAIRGEHPPFPHVRMGAEADIQPGLPVLAIGNPFGLGNVDDTPTVTAGRLGSGRLVRGVYTDCLQIDAPINPGNSGGPLLTPDGVLLGINGQIRTRTGMRINSGIGLAIACTQLAAFLPHLRDAPGRYVHHSAIPDALALTQDNDGAVTVAEWKPEDSTLQNLLAPSEQLISVAGRPVTSLDAAIGQFAGLPWSPDLHIPVSVQGIDGTIRTIEVPSGRTDIPGKPYHGIKVRQRDGGVSIKTVAVGSPAADAGIRAAWHVVSVNGRSVERRLDWLKATVSLDIGDEFVLEYRDPIDPEQLHTISFWLPAEGD